MKRYQYKAEDKFSGTYFRIPNTMAGREFLAKLRKYAATGVRLTARGRGSRREAREQSASSRKGVLSRAQLRQDLPPQFAESFAVYLRKPALERVTAEKRRKAMDYYAGLERQKASERANQIVLECQRLERDRAELIRQRDATMQTADRLREELRIAREALRNRASEDAREYRESRGPIVVNVFISKGAA